MDLALLIMIALVVIIALIAVTAIQKRPIRVNTSHRNISLKSNIYRTSTFDMRTLTDENIAMIRHRYQPMVFDKPDKLGRPVGALFTWSGKDSKAWYDMTGRFKHRNKGRQSGNVSSRISDPVGWSQRYVTLGTPFEIVTGQKSDKDTHLLERGHLIPYWASQDETTQKNLVPITQYTNKGFEGSGSDGLAMGTINPETMLYVESLIKEYVLSSGWQKRLANDTALQIKVKPIYHNDNYVPTRIVYLVQKVSLKGDHHTKSFRFKGMHVSADRMIRISVPVQMSDGTIVSDL